LPFWAISVFFSALSDTALALALEDSEICLTSSTVLVVWLTAVAVSTELAATCVAAASISADDDDSRSLILCFLLP